MATLGAIMDALASQIDNEIGSRGTADALIDGLQVDGRMVFNPTPPCIDIYPGDPSQEGLAFGRYNELSLIVRARVSTADHEAGQDLLLSMMDPDAATSVSEAIYADKTLGGLVGKLVVTGPSGFGIFPLSDEGSLVGCTWAVRIFP
jgi:hypothetical protein